MASALRRLSQSVGWTKNEDIAVIEEEESEDESENSEEEQIREGGPGVEAAKIVPAKEIYTESKQFCSVVAFIVAIHILLAGLKTDLHCRGNDCKTDGTSAIIWEMVDNLFTAIFVLEIIFRMYDANPRRYFCGERTRAKYKVNPINCIDFLVVCVRVFDVWILSLAGVTTQLRLVSWLRCVHFVPFVKTMQLNKAFRELWLVLSAFGETIRTLFWVGVMTIGVVWICGILMAIQTRSNEAEEFNFARSSWGFDQYWGKVLPSSYSLFQIATRDKWADSLVWPVVEQYPGVMFLFLCFLVVVTLALMNAIVGVVVECTLSASKANEALSRKDHEKIDKMVLNSLRQIFRDADTDGSGELDKQELEAALRSHSVRDRLRFLSIPFHDLMMLFHLLDEDGTALINIDMFFRGVARLRGQAAASDLHQMSVDLRRHIHWCDDHLVEVETLNDCLGGVVDMIDDFDTAIVCSEADNKDPVLKTRRERPKVSKGEVLRGRTSIWGESSGLPRGSKSQWVEFDESQIRDDRSGGNLSSKMSSKKASKDRQSSKATETSQQSLTAKNKVVDKARAKKQQALQMDQPAPPPLPLHLQRLKDQRDAKGPKKKKKDQQKPKGRNQFEF